ncbi:MAG: hypothetical protein K0M64_03385 [Rhizobium sp.]|nr:hypothetical protein [Rhizobium sp.]
MAAVRHHRRLPPAAALALAALLGLSAGHAGAGPERVAEDGNGRPLRIQGSVVVVEPDIELSEVTAGGMAEPRRDWSEAARRRYPVAVAERLAAAGVAHRPDFDVPDDLPADSRLGQVLRLNEAVALSIAYHARPGSELATKGDRLDWTLGGGVAELRSATGADYALFTYVRDSYASDGRKALRVLGLVAGAAFGGVVDIGGGRQVGVATLVDLRDGRVLWFNRIARQSGDLRDEAGARATAGELLRGFPL